MELKMWWSGTLADQKIEKRSSFTLALFLDRQGRAFECNITMKGKPQPPPAFLSRTVLLFVQVGLAFILARLVLYTYTASNPEDREVSSWFIAKFVLVVAFILCLCFQSFS